MLRSLAQRKHSPDGLSQLGHACHLVERPGDTGRNPKPRGRGPEAGLGHSRPWLTPNQAPLKNQAAACQCNRGTGAAAAAGKAEFTHCKKQPQDAGLDPQKGFAPSTNKAALASSYPLLCPPGQQESPLLAQLWRLIKTQQHQPRQSSGLRSALLILAPAKRSVNKAQNRQRTERQ